MKPAGLLVALSLFCVGAAHGASQAKAKPEVLSKAERDKRFDAHCADIMILQTKAVQSELAVTKDQRDKMNVFAQAYDAKAKKLKEELKASGKKSDKRLLDYFDELKAGVLKQLSHQQVVRLREISLQKFGLIALCDEVVGQQIGLSPDQQKKMRTTYDEGKLKFDTALGKVYEPYRKKVPHTQAEAEAIRAELKGKLAIAKYPLLAIRDDYDKRMRAIMTSTQKAAYAALLGKPYKEKPEPKSPAK